MTLNSIKQLFGSRKQVDKRTEIQTVGSLYFILAQLYIWLNMTNPQAEVSQGGGGAHLSDPTSLNILDLS